MSSDDTAKYTLLNGVSKTSEELNTEPEVLLSQIESLDFDNFKVLQKLREALIERSMTKGYKSAARHFGLTEKETVEILKEYLEEEANCEDNTLFPFDTFQKFTQTIYTGECTWRNIWVQAGDDDEPNPSNQLKDAGEKRLGRSYSTLEKIEAVKVFMQHSSQAAASRQLNIPTGSLIRWRDKLKNYLFQQTHVECLYGKKSQKKDRLFSDIDKLIYERVNRSKGRIDEAIKNEAVNIAKIDQNEPFISLEWVQNFKEHYGLTNMS